MKFMGKVVKDLLLMKDAVVFSEPVDPVLHKAPDYYQVIAEPRDLGTIKLSVEQGKYKTVDEIKKDVQLVWDNCKKYNPAPNAYYQIAEQMEKDWKRREETLPAFVNEMRDPTMAEIDQLPHKEGQFVRSQIFGSQQRAVSSGAAKSKVKYRQTAQNADGTWKETDFELNRTKERFPYQLDPTKRGMFQSQNRNLQGTRSNPQQYSTNYSEALIGDEQPLDADQLQQIRDSITDLEEDALQGLLDLSRDTGCLKTSGGEKKKENQMNKDQEQQDDDEDEDDEEVEIDIERMDNPTIIEYRDILDQSKTKALHKLLNLVHKERD
ncbi:MAG: hypothetical protein EZS28_041797 [Streblomastix strix]|uniref:Bromo domain-containing protein n=1 Tax=Streblomastix strix TaxID=222440 RepID=A0A5J4TW48_9EUKA|nr:MAG: hypothetical protein EZS28_041797 [Streblomastix strix]